VDNPAFDDMRLSVPGTVPRFLKIEGADGSSQSLRLWKGHNDVMVSEQLLPMTISTLSGARYRFGELVTNIRTVRILIVSPSDVAVEREIAVAVINEWNIRNKDIHKLELEAVLWEFHSAPESGDRVQGILNKQIVDKCDFAIAIFWKWIGPYTGVAPGGAVEEVQRLMQAGKQVMFYFSNASYRTKDVDLEQVAAIEQFKKSLQKNALVLDYYERHEFKDKLFHQLDLNLKRWYKLSAETGAIERFENQRLLQRYQETLKKHLSEVNLLGSRVIDSFSVQLADTFFSLRLSDTWRSDRRFETGFANDGMDGARTRNPEEVMSLVFKHHQLLLVIGDSGSGKTTLLKYYALSCMDDGQYRAFGFSEPVSVFYLPLRELKKSNHDHESLPAALASWCVKRYFKDISVESFDAWLERPSILVLLDGLDEISDVQERIAVCLWIDRTVKRFGKARFVVTSRSTGYRKGDGIEIVTSHVRADLMDITPEQQVEFLHKWFKAAYLRELHPDHMSEREWRETQEKRAHEKSIVLADYLNQEQNRSLRMMASQPLLLQIMAILWKERDYLPNSRMKLYDAALDYLLDYRNKQKAIYPLLPAEDARRVLSPVALWMQEKLGTDEADRVAMQKEMQTVLDTLSRSINASVFCRNLVDLTGVLVEYGDNQYVFRLKTFREYLAALQLKKNVYHNSGILDNLVPHFGDDWWSEVFRFFIELLGDEYLFEKFIQKLFESSVTENLTPKQQNLLLTLVREAPMKKYDVMIEKLFDSATTANRKHYLVECLKVIGREDALNAVLRYEKMEGGTVFVNPLELDANYILVRGGTFKYSVTNRTETVPDYWLARYPVTNRLYRRFINYLKTDKYGDRELIPVDRFMMELEGFADMNGLSDHHRLMQSDKGLANEFASSCDLDEHDDPFNRDEHPVVGITWYAAKAYCIWLSLMESRGETIALYRLPTEIEWEYAAAGKEGRAYPWGNSEPSPKLANYGNNERATTPVGTYPDGATPEGLHDMAGNVAEWMENWYDEAKPFRALRGGAWGIDSYALRCSARINFAPADWHNNFGFRVLRSANILES
jgi:formylglycine-generating enzyme required for sulfatase activity/energy-coupling factor transporter ATP-binding protein EcfA2